MGESMGEREPSKVYDLEERTFRFAKRTSEFVERLQKTSSNLEYGRQLIRSSGSVAANYVEANESLSKKDFIFRIKICRKEAKESRLWIRLVQCNEEMKTEQQVLFGESTELMKIFGAIVTRSVKS